ncbi:Flp pilus assembly complex ATPase component TadA [Paenibacillus taichungensis]|uniref:Flp pilus assembly complex ATPase component TadA n=1 Tax=Paenibacillus taichungensis TaxID=484184 RepID=A0ABX2MLI8_9BACL|nr:ATPase, T2SS/T4P/T4SS family [Paenibacillus taichungensis]NUU54918.1 Flp pilus assembly complex ATPase component TadA [Paenibacillus taichungensis]
MNNQSNVMTHLVATGNMTSAIRDLLCNAINEKQSILIIGPRKVEGKLKLLYSLAEYHTDTSLKSMVIEDHRLVNFNPGALNAVYTATNRQIKISLMKTALSIRSSYLFVSELRGSEIAPYFDVISEGLKGTMSTFVAKNPEHAIHKLSRLLSKDSTELTYEEGKFLERYVAAKIDLIVMIECTNEDDLNSWIVSDVVNVKQDQSGEISYHSAI